MRKYSNGKRESPSLGCASKPQFIRIAYSAVVALSSLAIMRTSLIATSTLKRMEASLSSYAYPIVVSDRKTQQLDPFVMSSTHIGVGVSNDSSLNTSIGNGTSESQTVPSVKSNRERRDFQDHSLHPTVRNGTNGNHSAAPSCVNSESLFHPLNISWPQVDDRLAQAMRNGIQICPQINHSRQESLTLRTQTVTKQYYEWNNTEWESPPKGLSTVVSCFFYTKAKHGRHEYKDWIPNMLGATDPMVIFVESVPAWYDHFDWVQFFKVSTVGALHVLLLHFGFVQRQLDISAEDDHSNFAEGRFQTTSFGC